MDRFHCEPIEWTDLFNYLDYMEVEGKITDHLRSIKKEQ